MTAADKTHNGLCIAADVRRYGDKFWSTFRRAATSCSGIARASGTWSRSGFRAARSPRRRSRRSISWCAPETVALQPDLQRVDGCHLATPLNPPSVRYHRPGARTHQFTGQKRTTAEATAGVPGAPDFPQYIPDLGTEPASARDRQFGVAPRAERPSLASCWADGRSDARAGRPYTRVVNHGRLRDASRAAQSPTRHLRRSAELAPGHCLLTAPPSGGPHVRDVELLVDGAYALTATGVHYLEEWPPVIEIAHLALRPVGNEHPSLLRYSRLVRR